MKKILSTLFVVFATMTACTKDPGVAQQQLNQYPAIFPDYTNVTIPQNIAPLNFEVRNATAIKATFSVDGKEQVTICGETTIKIESDDWNQLISNAGGKHIDVAVSVWSDEHPEGVLYKSFYINVAKDKIDPYVTYRLVDPGYEPWGKMGIFQRSLESFEEVSIVNNFDNRRRCINCHSFAEFDPNTFMYHQRSVNPGTIIVENGKLADKIDFKQMGRKQQAVYPKWHPSGRYIMFATCNNHQSFKNDGNIPLEVYDFDSDIFLYDVKQKKVLYDNRLNGDSLWQSFPTWSPDGKYLYYVCCNHPVKEMPDSSQLVKYDIMRIPFIAATGKFGSPIEKVYDATSMGGSASYPRISADGRYLLFASAKAGTFPIWHPDADQQIMDLKTGKMLDTRILNSSESDSYHCWSSNGRWIVFSSRRMDGRHTRLMIAYFDRQGRAHKPFMLPQENPEDNWLRIQAYNIPEFVKGKISYRPHY